MITVKRAAAGIFFLGSVYALINFMINILKGNVMLSLVGIIICSAAVCVPVAIASYLLVSSIPDTNNKFKVMRVFVFFVFAFYIVLLANMLFLNRYRSFIPTVSISEYARINVNIIPFKTIGSYIQSFINHSINKSIIFENLLGNIFVFAPMGILLPCIFKGLRRFVIFTVVMLVLLVGVEICQLLTLSGRCDIDDVILNFVGAVLFYGIFRGVIKGLFRKIYIVQ